MMTLIPNTKKEAARRKRAYAKRSQVLNLKKLIAKLEATVLPDRPSISGSDSLRPLEPRSSAACTPASPSPPRRSRRAAA